MSVFDVILAAIIVVGMFNLQRAMEEWLQRHIFKVGWLLTKNFQTTTIIYYTFFLPGIVIYELVSWLAAGMLDVHAEQVFEWPEKQEIGELRLNFIRVSKKAPAWKVAVINIAPLIVGLIIIWFVASNVIQVQDALVLLDDSSAGLAAAVQQIFSATDFALWAYFLFTVSNAMMPDAGVLKGWWWLMGAAALATLPLFVLGVGEEFVGDALTGPIASVLNGLSTIFGLLIILEFIGLCILGLLESIIEYITGDSATFQNGKMVVMTRKEAMEYRRQERMKAKQASAKKNKRPALPQGGTPSIYKLPLPIPDAPGREPVTSLSTIIESEEEPPVLPNRPRREEPDMIPSVAQRVDDLDEEADE